MTLREDARQQSTHKPMKISYYTTFAQVQLFIDYHIDCFLQIRNGKAFYCKYMENNYFPVSRFPVFFLLIHKLHITVRVVNKTDHITSLFTNHYGSPRAYEINLQEPFQSGPSLIPCSSPPLTIQDSGSFKSQSEGDSTQPHFPSIFTVVNSHHDLTPYSSFYS